MGAIGAHFSDDQRSLMCSAGKWTTGRLGRPHTAGRCLIGPSIRRSAPWVAGALSVGRAIQALLLASNQSLAHHKERPMNTRTIAIVALVLVVILILFLVL
jgi:hypothetical protein